jgi:hypothetical protein
VLRKPFSARLLAMRLAWFFGLWIASVASLGAVAAVIRAALTP